MKKEVKKKDPQIYKLKKTFWLFALCRLIHVMPHTLITGHEHFVKLIFVL